MSLSVGCWRKTESNQSVLHGSGLKLRGNNKMYNHLKLCAELHTAQLLSAANHGGGDGH